MKDIIAKKGYEPLKLAIDKSINDLIKAQYNREEIKETLNDMFGKDAYLKQYLISKGY